MDAVDLDVPAGGFTVLLGPSGSGKSTILSLIAGLEAPDEGRILLGAERIDRRRPGDRDVAMVFQSYALYPHMTVRQNLAFPLESQGTPRREIAGRVVETAAILQLERLLDRRPAQLSGGEQQRVALGRAIIRSPRAFLMDEPLSGLDERLRVQTRFQLTALHARLGITTLFVTHSQVEAMTMGQQIAIMDAGRLRQVGLPQEVYDWPADTFVADFLGSPPMNLLKARWVVESGAHRLFAGETSLDLLARWHGQRERLDGDEVIIGVRPEHVAIDSGGTLRGSVRAVESHGHESIALVATPLGSVAVRTDVLSGLRPGDDVALSIDPAAVRLFDPATGARL